MRRALPCIILAALQLAASRCPPKPTDFTEIDATPARSPLSACDELADYDAGHSLASVRARMAGCTAKPEPCQWRVVNLGLEKTGTSEVANLLRLLHVANFSFASPRGAANG